MKYMLDTNIWIYLFNRSSIGLIQRIKEKEPGDICISSITLAELKFGFRKSRKSAQNLAALSKALIPFEIMSFGAEECDEYAEIRLSLETRGKKIGPLDTMIAAHARTLGVTLVTNNVREFERVEGLLIENWV